MSYSEVGANLELIKWRNEYWQEYVADSRYGKYMSSSPTALFMTFRELTDGGKDMIIPLVGSLKGRGVGAGLLTGAEEKLDTFDFRVRPVWRRNAVVVKKSTIKKSVIDILRANKGALKLWSADDMRDRITETFSVVDETDNRFDEDEGYSRQVPYAEATATQRNNWLTDNYNRALFGNAQANTVAGNFASSLANVDTTNDNWGSVVISAAKELAETRDRVSGRRAVRPWMVGGDGNDGYVLFLPSRAFNKTKQDTDIKAFNKDAFNVPKDNPYFKSGDLIWDNVIIKKIPELPVLTGVGTSSADVAPGYLCGAQSMAVSWGQDPISTKRADDDYGFITGVGTEELRGIDKTFFKATTDVGPGQQHGMVSVYAAV